LGLSEAQQEIIVELSAGTYFSLRPERVFKRILGSVDISSSYPENTPFDTPFGTLRATQGAFSGRFRTLRYAWRALSVRNRQMSTEPNTWSEERRFNMAQTVYKLFLVKMSEAWYQLSQEEKDEFSS
jgi:hypothetical protein